MFVRGFTSKKKARFFVFDTTAAGNKGAVIDFSASMKSPALENKPRSKRVKIIDSMVALCGWPVMLAVEDDIYRHCKRAKTFPARPIK
jgi:hypothetical protein